MVSKNNYQWAVIGAGPAGIATIGQLIDNGVNPADVIWIDPFFTAGDLGRLWQNVSSNTKVQLFIDFLKATKSFEYDKSNNDFTIHQLPPLDTCDLKHVVAPLQWVSDRLCHKTNSFKATVNSIERDSGLWQLNCSDNIFYAKNVVLTTGSEPNYLNYHGIEKIAFEHAIDKAKLAAQFEPDKTYAVFGSSHSAIIIVRHLVELGAKKILNFYRQPCRYAVNMGDWILFDNTGLKGQTAEWAQENIDGIQPYNLERHLSNTINVEQLLPSCDKVIYATGFTRRNSLAIKGLEQPEYNPYTGIIAPGLFGAGIAYPEKNTDKAGNTEMQVGMWKFMTYLSRIMPIWLNYPPT